MCLLQIGLCPTHKDADNFPFTAPGAKFNLHTQNVLAAGGRLRLIDAKLIDAATGVNFDLSNTDPARIMVKPGKAPQYGDTFFELFLEPESSAKPFYFGAKYSSSNRAGINRHTLNIVQAVERNVFSLSS